MSSSAIGLAIKRSILGLAATLLIVAYPARVLADETSCPSTSGTTAPTGAAESTYHFNSDTCLWENDYYTWDPITKVTTPKTPPTYVYNSVTGQYDMDSWMFDAAAGQYQKVTLHFTQPPDGANVIGGPPPPAPVTTPTDTPTDSNNPATQTNTDGASTPDSSSTGTTSFDSAGNVTVNNTLISGAYSGDAIVLGNTTAGDATSGSASATATLINLLQSSVGMMGASTFTFDIAGNVQGDILIDPSQILSSSNLSSNSSPSDVTINTSDRSQINNNLSINAGTGNATVMGNTTAGDATTGDSAAMANVVNVINTLIGSGSSFLGTINIYGSLDGDILLPPDVLQTLLSAAAANSPTGSSDTSVTNNTNQSINNQINLTAASGNATVSGNTTAGNATTGEASTALTILNMTGADITGKDILVVFVNVMGNWSGCCLTLRQVRHRQ